MSLLSGPLGFGILSVIVLYFAKRTHYFAFPHEMEWKFPIRWFHIVTVFAIYFVVVIFVVPLISFAIQLSPLIASLTWVNFLSSFTILAAVFLYSSMLPREIFFKIWRRDLHQPYWQDIRFALMSFLIAFPIVIFANEVLDLILTKIFSVSSLPDQLAVRFLKMTFDYPLYLFLSIVTIVGFAPFLEEILFRGFLQSLIRQHLGSKLAIWITAICFSFFHYSPEQGMANISIIGSLFPLALFLGFTYEKQGSLIASIFLHASFNAISTLNLYFVGGFPKNL
jgi:membrane protease YdiL (CAAX protease family)